MLASELDTGTSWAGRPTTGAQRYGRMKKERPEDRRAARRS